MKVISYESATKRTRCVGAPHVKVIQPTKPVGSGGAERRHRRGVASSLHVAAYCRMSTDSLEQETSFDSQVRHYTDYIGSHPGWELAGIYADEGISGTSTKHRDQFKDMMAACERGEIDLIITKSISRWARNTVDFLTTIRHLRDLGVRVLFEKEGIDTMDSAGEVLITIMSSLAQQESDSISKNVRMGIQYQMQQGKGRLNTKRFLGYSKDPNTGKLVIVPEEADVIRDIYRAYLDGYSPGLIAKRLMAKGVMPPGSGSTWYASTVASILRNEKYCGDLLMQKYYVQDFLTHRIARNTGQLPQYYVEGDHEPIVPREVWLQVKGEMARRAAIRGEPLKLRFGSMQALRGRLVCGKCGSVLKRNRDSSWHCEECERDGTSVRAGDSEAKRAVLLALNEVLCMRDVLARRLRALEDEATRLKATSADASNQRAALMNDAVQVRSLLDLAELRDGLAKDALMIDTPCAPAACAEYEDFFNRTCYRPPEDAFDAFGNVCTFHDDMIVRYLKSVVVLCGGYEVRFKCGLARKRGTEGILHHRLFEN